MADNKPGDVNGDGLIDMRIDAVEKANPDLRAAVDKLAARWQTLKTEIAAQAAKLPPGTKISDAFRQGSGDEPGYDKRERSLINGSNGDDGIEGSKGFIEGYRAFPAKVDEAIRIYREGELTAVQELFRAKP